jgi:RNA polymerase sigma-70 factor (ECF subfamily)
MTPTVDQLDVWIVGLRQGQPQVLSDFWHHYGPMLERLADKNLGKGMRARLGPDDVVQSVCRTFFRRAQEGQFTFEDQDTLWRLLVAITLTKVREKTRYHMRARRGMQMETPLAGGDESGAGLGLAASGPSPDELAEFSDLLEATLAGLDEEERQVLQLKLQDLTHEETAERMGCSERTVRRMLKKVQGRLERMLEK